MATLFSVAGSAAEAYGAYSSYQSGGVQQQAIDYQTRQEVANLEAERQAQEVQARWDIEQLARDGSRRVGATAAALATNGTLWGSSLDVLNDQATEVRRDIAMRAWQADTNESFNVANQQTVRTQGRYAKAGAKLDRTTNLLRGVNSSLRVGSQLYGAFGG